MTRNLIKHDDPGHGWLAVKRADLGTLGIVDKISRFSYQRGATVYLEEDCDMTTYIEAAHAAGWIVTWRNSRQERTPIRGYDHYRA